MMSDRYRGGIYTGMTANLAERITQHREGKGSAFVAKYAFTRLVYAERHDLIVDAIAREKAIKKWRRAWKIELIETMTRIGMISTAGFRAKVARQRSGIPAFAGMTRYVLDLEISLDAIWPSTSDFRLLANQALSATIRSRQNSPTRACRPACCSPTTPKSTRSTANGAARTSRPMCCPSPCWSAANCLPWPRKARPKCSAILPSPMRPARARRRKRASA